MALTPELRQELRRRMQERRRDLVAELHEDTDRVREDRFEDIAGAAPDPADQSVAALIGDLDHADVSRDMGELRALDAALARMEEGSYGTCADCGGEIEPERLRASPSAARCIRCQRLHEKTYASPAGPSL